MAGATLNEIINAMMGGDGKGGLSPVTKDIVEDVMPMIEATYKVSKRPDDRAIAGLSMGGGHSINISFVRPELFRYVALMSPAAGGGVAKMYPRIAEKPDILNKQFKMLWVGVGKDDGLTGPGDKAFSEALTKIGVKHEFVLTEGRHEWTVWRHYLNDIAPKLFR
jgi:enterochelin esterase-like enzyme